jgi:hypothetical protein
MRVSDLELLGVGLATFVSYYICDDWIGGAAILTLWLCVKLTSTHDRLFVLPLAVTFQWTQSVLGVFYKALTGREVLAHYASDYRPMVLIGLGCCLALATGIMNGDEPTVGGTPTRGKQQQGGRKLVKRVDADHAAFACMRLGSLAHTAGDLDHAAELLREASARAAAVEASLAVAQADVADIDLAVKAARKAFDEGPWPKMSPHERGRIVWRLGDLIQQNLDEMARLDSKKMSQQRYLQRKEVLRLRADTPPARIRNFASFVSGILENHEGCDPAHPPSVRIGLGDDAVLVTISYSYHPPNAAAFAAFNEKVTLQILEGMAKEGVQLAQASKN